jgi:hypothetical protein
MVIMKRLAFYLCLLFAVSCTSGYESVYEQELIRIDKVLEYAGFYLEADEIFAQTDTTLLFRTENSKHLPAFGQRKKSIYTSTLRSVLMQSHISRWL